MKILNEAHNQNGHHRSTNESLTDKTSSSTSLSTSDIETRLEDNGTHSNELQDPLSPLDTIPFSVEGIQTVIKNNQEKITKKSLENKFSSESLLRLELQKYKEESGQLRAALKEASKVNQQWRNYHDQRQGYVQKLLASLHELQQSTLNTQVGGKTSAELQRLRETLSRQQKEHREHIQLLQLQVRAHRDDWEAERNEKKAAEEGRLQAEAKVAHLQEQLEQTKNAFVDLEARYRLCQCSSVANGETNRNVSLNSSNDKMHNGNVIIDERIKRISPNRSSSNSNLSDGTRSRSMSKDLSNSASPTPGRSVSASSSPSLGLSSDQELPSDYVMNWNGQSNDKEVMEHRSKTNSALIQENPPILWNPSPTLNLIADNSPNDEFLIPVRSLASASIRNSTNDVSELEPLNKLATKVNGRCAESSLIGNNLEYYESKGARPKVGKITDEDEKLAKHRARSILASALPLSPSSSNPSSPVTVSLSKSSNVPKGYLPITSTVLTSVTYRPPFPTSKRLNHNHNDDVNQTTINHNSATASIHSHLKKTNKLKQSLKKVDVNLTQKTDKHSTRINKATHRSDHGQSSSHKEKTFTGHSTEISMNDECSHETDNKQFSAMQINESDCQNHCDHEVLVPKTIYYREGQTKLAKFIQDDSEQTTVNDFNLCDIKTASKMKQNNKSLTVTNSQQDILNTNYAAITIMPGPSSALYSHSQTTSTTSSRSSSPGFSLTTFALNAKGQGVPGAIFFALGSETKPLKGSHQSCMSVVSSSSCNEAVEEKIKPTQNNSDSPSASNISTTNSDDLQNNVPNARLINSTWVRLMDKENNSTRSGSGIPWRTARAVPSHQLNSVKKTSQEDNSINGIISSVSSVTKPNNSTVVYSQASTYNYRVSHSNAHSNTQNVVPTQSNAGDAKCSPNISPTPNYISYAHTANDSSVMSSCVPAYPQPIPKGGSQSPSICVISHSSMTSLSPHADSHLRSRASRNISSAILSYECGSRACVSHQGDENLVEFQNQHIICSSNQNSSELSENLALEESWTQLICPSCQKLFSQEQSHEYEKHLQLCGGPKYVDM